MPPGSFKFPEEYMWKLHMEDMAAHWILQRKPGIMAEDRGTNKLINYSYQVLAMKFWVDGDSKVGHSSQ